MLVLIALDEKELANARAAYSSNVRRAFPTAVTVRQPSVTVAKASIGVRE